MKQVSENVNFLAEIFNISGADKNMKSFVSDVLVGNEVVDCPDCDENALHLTINDVERSQAFFCCLNDSCGSKFRVDKENKTVNKL